MLDKILRIADNNLEYYLELYYKFVSSIFYTIIIWRYMSSSIIPFEETIIMMDFKYYVQICFNIMVTIYFTQSSYETFKTTKKQINDERLGAFFNTASNIVKTLGKNK